MFLIQMFHRHVLVEVFTSSFPMLIISLVLQRPEELINISTGTLNYNAFTEEVKLNYMAKHPFDIIFIKIKSFELLNRKLKDENLKNYINQLIKKLRVLTNQYGVELYYLENGMISILSINDNDDFKNETAPQISTLLNNLNINENIDSMVDTNICFAHCPDDLPDFNAINNFIQNIENILTIYNLVHF